MAVLIEREDYEFLLRSVKLCGQIDKYTTLLGLNPDEVAVYKNENELLNYVFEHCSWYGSLAESFMEYKICNMQVLYRDLVWQCRNSKNYTQKIGEDLGIAGTLSDKAIEDSPKLIISYTPEGHPVLKWPGGIFKSVEIWKDSGNGKGYEKLDKCSTGEYIDRTVLPGNNRQVWKYSVIYLIKDEMVGNWSEEQEVIVHNHFY